MPEIITINPCNPEGKRIERAVSILKEGGVVAYPTETFYGLGAHAGIGKAVEKVFLVKGRNLNHPLPLIIQDEKMVETLARDIPPVSRKLMQAFWPGALTMVFHASSLIDLRLTADTGKIGLRVSSHPIAAALPKVLRYPVTATSANISGEKECSSAREVLDRLGDRIDALIDGGRTPGGTGSTVLDMTAEPPEIIREGAVALSAICAVLKREGKM